LKVAVNSSMPRSMLLEVYDELSGYYFDCHGLGQHSLLISINPGSLIFIIITQRHPRNEVESKVTLHNITYLIMRDNSHTF
jgi:hypothetical protein